MARKSKKKDLSLVSREILAIVLLAMGFFISISLFSYHPADPSFVSLQNTGQLKNWGGIVGAYTSDSLMFVLGGGAYVVGFLLLLTGFHFLLGIKTELSLASIPLYMFFIVMVSLFCQLVIQQFHFLDFNLEAGGLVGGALSSVLVEYLGKPGAYLISFFGVLVGLVFATHVSLGNISYNIFQFSKRVSAFALSYGRVYWGRLNKAAVQVKEDFSAAKIEEEKKNKLALRTKRNLDDEDESELSVGANDDHDPEDDESEVSEISEISEVSVVNPFSKKKEVKVAPKQVVPVKENINERKLFSDEPTNGPKILAKVEPPKKAPESKQVPFATLMGDYQLPPLALLDAEQVKQQSPVDEASLKANARMLEKKLKDFSVEGSVTEIHPGPVITMYEFQPAAGVKLSRIANLSDDLSLAMGGRSVRIVAPLPNKPAVGIEIPNNDRETVYLKDIIADDKFQKMDSKIPIALGKDIEGAPYSGDLAKMPHLLIAGATGSGKSVSINATILSFLYKSSPEDVRLIMVDPKMLELSIYEGIPHLLLPVVTEPKKANLALRWAVREMERRYKMMADINARNIINYNQKLEKNNYVSKQQEKIKEMGNVVYAEEDLIKHEGKIPYIVIIIDELADLMMVAGRDVEESITRLAQMARAAGIHLILATQRPSVDVITGIIKANFPARIAFKVSSKHDSRTVLDANGADRLLGAGDMLFIPPNSSRMVRVHGAFITETEVQRVVDFLKQQGKPVYDESILQPIEAEASGLEGIDGADEEVDALYDQAVAIVTETRQASISMVQRRLRVGYNRAARMIEKMEAEGIVSSPTGAGNRQVLVSSLSAEG